MIVHGRFQDPILMKQVKQESRRPIRIGCAVSFLEEKMYTITLEVNQICNLRCDYCYLGEKSNQRRIFMSDVKLENVELKEEEVNIYTPDCGVTRKACTTDCFMTTCLITCAE